MSAFPPPPSLPLDPGHDPIRASDEAVLRLRANHPTLIDLTTGRVERLLAALGHPERRLPPGFQKSEFLVERGMVDRVVARAELPQVLGSILKTLTMGRSRLSSAA